MIQFANGKRAAAIAVLALVTASCEPSVPPPTASPAEILATQGAGQAFLQQDQLTEARAEYLRLTEMAPDESAGYAGLGLVALKAGDLDEAERRLIEARDRSPDDPQLPLALARIEMERGATDQALTILREAFVVDSTHARTLWALAEFERDGNGADSPQRVEWLRRVIASAPGNLAAHVELIDAEFAAGNADAARGGLETFRQLAPDLTPRSSALFEAAEDATLVGDLPSAIASFAQFRENFEVTGPYQDGLSTLAPPPGELVGVPQLSFSFRTGSLRVLESETVLASLRFADASELAGFESLGADAAGAESTGGAQSTAGDASAAIAVGDFDGDGDEDLVWASDGRARLLRVDFGSFVDAADDLGVLTVGNVGAAVWGDFDDDRRLDVWLTGETTHVFQSRPADDGSIGSFDEIELSPGTAAGGAGNTVTPGAANDVFFADLDQDGDLDTFEARDGPNRLYRNNGDGTFAEMADAFGVAGAADADTRGAAFADLDNDRDLDLVFADGAGGLRLLSNERGGRFQDETEILGAGANGDAQAVAVADIDSDGRLDIIVAGTGGIRLLRSGERGFELDTRSGSALRPADFEPRDLELIDFDNDGWIDVGAGGSSGAASGLRLFRNEGEGRFADAARFLPDVPGGVQALESFDYNEDGDIDLIVLGEDGRPRLLRNDGGNANHYLQLELVGLGEGSRKNNRFGIGARVEVRAGDLYQVHTVTDPTLLIGLNGRLKADVIRVHWPNGVPQDLYFPGTDQDLVEQQTLKGSCPLLYVWDGDGFEFVGDIMWKSALGMPLGILGGDGQRAYAPAFPSQEYRRLPAGVLQPRDGEYVMQVTEELWETIYVDGISLVAVDHLSEFDVYVNERFVPPAPTALELWRVGERHLPVSALDGNGIDQSATLAARDFDYVSSFRPGRYQGIAEAHELVLDLGEDAASGDVTLFMTGWIFPTDASINVAMAQSDALQSAFPSLDVIGPDGEWQVAIPDLGFPSGKDKTVIADLRGLFPTDDRRVRIRTNLMVYWDEAFFTTGKAQPEASEHRVMAVPPKEADLHYRGFSRELRKGGRYGPHWFDYATVAADPKWHDLEGNYTRFGDVSDLVTEGDDRYVIANAGDEITLRFDVEAFPALVDGWKRTFLIYSDGWVKDGDLNTASGERAAPLPFRQQLQYPFQAQPYGADPMREATAEAYQTRPVAPARTLDRPN